MATYYSQADGAWSTLANWDTVRGGGGSDPASVADMDDDTFVIQATHAIEFDVDMSAFANGIAGLTIEGGADPGLLYSKFSGAGTYHLMIKTGTAIAGTTSTNRGRLLANSDGVWGNTGALPFDRKFIIDLKGTAVLTGTDLDIALYDTEPTYTEVATYKTKQTVTAEADDDTFTCASHGWANGTALMFKVAGGSLPTPINANYVYYVVNTATNTFQVALVSGGTAVNLTTDGSGTIEAYDGHTNTATGVMNVLTDVTGDSQWIATAAVVLVDCNAPSDYDQQRTTLSAVAAGTITLAANVDSAQYPGAKIFLVMRNIAICNNGTSSSQAIVNYSTGSTHGGVFRCEIRNTTGTGTTFYGTGVNYGTGHTISGTVSGCGTGVSYGTGHTISGTVSGCSSGVSYGTGHTISGTVSGCSSGVNYGTGHTISGTVSGCSSGVSFGTGHTISGTVSGCGTGVSYSTGHTISGTVSGCGTGVNYGTGHTISGTVSGCSSGVGFGTGHTISGTVSGCSSGVNSGTGHTISGTVSGCTYTIRIDTTGPEDIVIKGNASIPIPPIFYGRNVAGDGRRGCKCEDYNGVLGASYAFYCTGDVIKNTTTVRDGGAASSIEVVPLSACATNGKIPIFEWMEFDVPASEQTRKIYVLGSGWTGFPTAAQLYFEAEYMSNGTTFAKTVLASTEVLVDNTTWTALDVVFTPAAVAPVIYRAYLGKYEAACKVYIDNALYTS